MVNTIQNKIRISLQEIFILTAAIALAASFALPAFAATLTSASVTLSDSRPSTASVSYDFAASGVTNTNAQCITFQFDTDSDGTGGLPTGMNLASADISGSSDLTPTAADWDPTVSGNVVSFNHNDTGESLTNGNLIITGITNGSVADTGYYLIVNTYNDQDCSSSQIDTATVQFIFTQGTSVSLTVDAAFTFTVAGIDHTDGSPNVNGEDLTVTTSSTAVPFSLVGPAENAVGAQNLTISTNAQNGYNIYLKQTVPLTNGASDTIDAVSEDTACTYNNPANFSTPGTEAFGFTTNNAAISAGIAGTFLTNNWCDVTDSNQAVATSTDPTSGEETTRVGYQAGISAITAPGTYQNTIIYTAVPTY